MTYEEVQKIIKNLPEYEDLGSLFEAHNGSFPEGSHLFVDNDFVAIRQEFLYKWEEDEEDEELEYHYFWTCRGDPRYALIDILEHISDLEVWWA